MSQREVQAVSSEYGPEIPSETPAKSWRFPISFRAILIVAAISMAVLGFLGARGYLP